MKSTLVNGMEYLNQLAGAFLGRSYRPTHCAKCTILLQSDTLLPICIEDKVD